MNRKTYIHKAAATEIDRIAMFCEANPGPGSPVGNLRAMVTSDCLLKTKHQGRLAGVVGLDLSRNAITGPWIRKGPDKNDLAHRMLVSAERLAAQYGMTQIIVYPAPDAAGFFADNGYWKVAGSFRGKTSRTGMTRSIIRRATHFGRLVREINEELGIPTDYGMRHKMRLQPEAGKLYSIGNDIYDRKQKMTPPAATAWRRMVRQAKSNGVIIQAVSAFRSVDYQAELVRRKLEKNQSMEEILSVSAAPGYSEHHTGQAVDVTTPGFPVLEKEFEKSPAFEWLCDSAADFNFHLSFPRNNIHDIAYEPWHWCWRGNKKNSRG